jgi:tetratricopeptide (TPR) repeat protein
MDAILVRIYDSSPQETVDYNLDTILRSIALRQGLAVYGIAYVALCLAASASDNITLEASGMAAFRIRDFASAERIFLRLIAANPSAHSWKLLGTTYVAEEKYNLAAPAFERACSLDSREIMACYYLGRTQLTLVRLEDALHSFQLALESRSAPRGRVLLGMALVYEAMLQPVEAETFFRDAIRAGEHNALRDYGLFLFKSGRTSESLGVLEKAGAAADLARVREALRKKALADSAVPVRPVRFSETPLPMVVKNGATDQHHLIETMIAGVAIFDFDNDGWPDIFVANGAPIPKLTKDDASWSNRLFRNNRDGTFTDVTAKSGLGGSGFSMGAAAGDFDNDGNIDLFVTGVRSNALYRNRGDGTFEEVTKAAGLESNGKWSVAAGWFDFDNDGLLDLFVVRYVDWDPAREPFCGAAADPLFHRPGYRQYCNPSLYRPLANALYRNFGGGRFRDVSAETEIAYYAGKGMGVTFGDFDGDGRLDIFVANDTKPNFLLHNEGGRFRDIALEAGVAYGDDGKALSSMGADFRDFDNDGREDLFVTALSDESFPLFRNSDNHFTDASDSIGLAARPFTGWSTGMFDFNNDGWKDLFVAAGHVMDNAQMSSSRKSREPDLVFLNHGGRKFDLQMLAGEALHRGAAFGDFDRDGRVDVVVTRLNESPLVLWNRTEGGNWIDFRLIGHRSNRDGIGAMIHIATSADQQWNRVTTSTGYGASSDRVAHFGLGDATIVSNVEILWPSGILQRLSAVSANQLLTIHEP